MIYLRKNWMKLLRQIILNMMILGTLGLLINSAMFIAPDRSIKRNIATQINMIKSIYTSIKYYASDCVLSNFPHRVVAPDNMVQVSVPAGSFIMGANDGKGSPNSPQHLVDLDAFWIDQIEVTNHMYWLCLQKNSCTPPAPENRFFINPLFSSYPIVYITWDQALQYCNWAGRDLPTEAQWEKSARGTTGEIYPWGSDTPTNGFGNFDNKVGTIISATTYAAGASPYGALNMVSNVREWVKDKYNPTYYQRSPLINPNGSQQGSMRSLRGGSFLDTVDRLTTFFRFAHEPSSPGINRGFRCVSNER